ncbi:MAG TPA: ChaN family lipoprotein [Nitrospirales bacterium]|nr:ChaN family lipoprotein [Nitrospirales bacterium]
MRLPTFMFAVAFLTSTFPPLILPAAATSERAIGDILATASGRTLATAEFWDRLAKLDVIYIGEEHHNRAHVEAAVSVLEALLARGRAPALALEMFGWDAQGALDRYAGNSTSREAFLHEAQWERNWGGPFEDYEPLLATARRHGLALVALNPPLPVVRRVAKSGLVDALFDPETTRWNMHRETFVDNPEYRRTIIDQLRRCHGGMRDEGYERMYQASLFRDEAMARTIAGVLTTRSPVVSYTGGGHIQRGLPVPDRVKRRRPDASSATIYLMAFDRTRAGDIDELIASGIADYVWLTSVSEHGPPARCG